MGGTGEEAVRVDVVNTLYPFMNFSKSKTFRIDIITQCGIQKCRVQCEEGQIYVSELHKHLKADKNRTVCLLRSGSQVLSKNGSAEVKTWQFGEDVLEKLERDQACGSMSVFDYRRTALIQHVAMLEAVMEWVEW